MASALYRGTSIEPIGRMLQHCLNVMTRRIARPTRMLTWKLAQHTDCYEALGQQASNGYTEGLACCPPPCPPLRTKHMQLTLQRLRSSV